MTTDPALEELRRYLLARGGGLYIGSGRGGLALAAPQHAALVLGPPRSGKTSTLVIPNVLAAPGAVLTTSTKPDILAATVERRARLGRCWLLDPTGTVRVPDGVTAIRWSPVHACSVWDEAVVAVRAMVGAGRPPIRAGEADHWTERAEAMLAPLLHAAALGGGDMEQVVRWVLRQDLDAPYAELNAHGATLAADVLAGLAATEGRELSGIWSTTAGVLGAYRSEAALAAARAPNFDPRALPATSDTVFVCAPARYQSIAAPIVVAFIEQLRAGAFALAAAGAAQGSAVPPVVLALDELANVAPIPDLPSLVSEGGSQGVLTLGCLQDLSQARQRWGPAADGFLSLFGTKVVLGGIADLATLELVSRLAGEVDLPVRSVSRGAWWASGHGAPTSTWSTRRQRRLPVDAVSQQPAGTALVLVGNRPPTWVALEPWWGLEPFARNSTAERQFAQRRANVEVGRDL
jgi:type IV secretion system protein VirD4